MKYCRNCGTLLEDTHEHCIRCGMDVTIPENVSLYPIEVMETLEIENQRKEEQRKQEITEKLQEERTTKAEKLSTILDRLKVIRNGPGGIKGALSEFQELNDRRIVLEQDLEFIDKKLGRLVT